MRKNIFILFMGLFGLNNAPAQLLELPKNIQSPNAASLGKYGDIPMNLYTGRSDVGIQLYTANEGGIPLDINLNYDTGGVRVNDVPGWVGQNWILNAGGVITRSVRGKTFDELKFQGAGASSGQKGYYYHYQRLNTSNWNSFQNLMNLADLGYSYSQEHPDTYNMDLAPDIFTFNFMGNTGKFFLGEDGKWKVSSNKNFKVKINELDFVRALGMTYFGYYASSSTYRGVVIGKIEMTDDDGNTYIFGKTQDEIEFTIPNFDDQTIAAIFPNAWYLSEVYNKYGSKVYSFEYERGNDQVALYPHLKNETYKRDGCWNGGVYYPSFNYGDNTIGNQQMEIVGDLIKPVFLKKINLLKSGNNIQFSSENSNSLKYKRGSEELLDRYIYKKVDFFNSVPGGLGVSAWDYFKKYYFYTAHFPVNNGDPKNELAAENRSFITGTSTYWDTMDKLFDSWKWRKLNAIYVKNSLNNTIKMVEFNYTNIPTTRLKLNNVKIDGQYNYAFEYNNLEALPSFTSKSFDHFGYYNGSQFNTAGQPGFNYSDYYSYRQTNSDLVKYGSLTKITYPTGGFSEFEYEPHSYSSYVKDDRSGMDAESGIVGGLRIKKIQSTASTGNKIIKEYLYKNSIGDVNTNGVLLSKNKYYINDWKGNSSKCGFFYQRAFSMGSIIPMSNFSGTQIEYPKVIERQMDANNNSIGYTVYNYYNYNDYKDSFAGSIQFQFSIFDEHTDISFKRGQLKLKQFYDQSNIKKLEEEYNYASADLRKVRAFNYKIFPTGNFQGSPDGNTGTGGTAYEIYYSDNNLINKILRTYDQSGNYVSETESYNYIDRENFGDNFLRSKSKITTNNEILKEEYQYTFDKNGTEPYTSLTNRREYSVISTNKTLNTAKLSSSKVDYAQMPVQIYPQKFYESKDDNPLEEKLMVDAYDSDGNILQAHKPDGKYIFYFYAYNNRYPIMKIEGPKDVPPGKQPFSYYASLLKTKVEAATPDMNDIVKNQFYTVSYYPEHLITCYTFKPDIGVTNIMKPNASVEFYNYDSIGRLISIKDINGKTIKDFSYELANQ